MAPEMERLKVLAAEYGNPHKCFAQILLQRKLFPVQHVGNVFLKTCQLYAKDPKPTDFEIKTKANKELLEVLRNTMNPMLALVGLRMTTVADELHRSMEYVAVISDQNYSENLACATGLSTDELGVFRIWMDLMFMRNEGDEGNTIGEVRTHKAMNCNTGGARNIEEKVQKKLMNQNWIVLDHNRDVVRLHTFALAELSASLQEEYDLPGCSLCNHVIFIRRLSYRCQCEAYFHVRCLLKHIKGPSVRCPAENCELYIERNSLNIYDDEFVA
ncbi:hypothetical protein Ddc_03411 [Ditylenchus destructor]|nr:hypothetical protein Ddc_03411 [Ditylenchus destructor]